MKGQYFSFDAVIATVIMVVAITSLAAYWLGVQSVVESRNNPLYADALRIAESLVSPGSPANWTEESGLDSVRQIGLAKSYDGELDAGKILAFRDLVQTQLKYNETRRLMRAPSEYFITIQRTDVAGDALMDFEIGAPLLANATEVAIAHRGAILEGKPMRITVYLWRK